MDENAGSSPVPDHDLLHCVDPVWGLVTVLVVLAVMAVVLALVFIGNRREDRLREAENAPRTWKG